MHYKNGGSHLFIDEAHYLKNWQQMIKNIYYDYPSMHIVYTGSSLLRLDADSGDLSRRQIVYSLPGLSFREYLLVVYIAYLGSVLRRVGICGGIYIECVGCLCDVGFRQPV